MTNENHMTNRKHKTIRRHKQQTIDDGTYDNDLTMDKIDELLRLKTFELFGQIT